MPQIKTIQVFSVCLFMILISLGGCGSERNDQSPINPDTGHHAGGWLPAAHMTAAKTDPAACSTCHGADFKGGISGVSCTSCHLGSPSSVHPTDWNPVYSTHGPYVTANGTGACANQYCHGLSLTGVLNSGPSCTACHLGGLTAGHPADWVPVYSTHGPYVIANGTSACANQYCHGTSLTGVANSGPSCTSCHMGGVTQIHPAAWLGDACSSHGSYAYTNGTAGCANAACHGANLGGVSQSGPSCTQCHNPIPNSNQCNYCHGIPPNGTAYPNEAGKHSKHMQLSNVTCTTCHARSCDQHGNGTVEVTFDAIYNAKTGTASFNATSKTCSEISCHGGPRTQTPNEASMNPPQSSPAQTPDWYTGSINVYDSPQYDYAECSACHIYGTTEYNSYSSGKHFYHVISQGYLCDACHDFNKLAVNHFTGLNSPVISAGTASATILNYLQYDGQSCNNHTCHSPYLRNWWQ